MKITKYVQINQEFKAFINRNEDFRIKYLLTIHEYIERLCYNQIEENDVVDFHIDICPETKEVIEKYYEILPPNSIIT